MTRGPGVITGASLMATPLVALLLAMIPFGGAPEHVIAGVSLLTLGLGCGAIGLLTTRYSTQPQRWALTPAMLLLMAGAVSLSWPGSVRNAMVSWSWPAALLGLVVVVGLRARRELQSRARRWVLYPALVGLSLAAVAGVYEMVAEARDAHGHPFPGRMIEVQGRRLHLDCRGDQGPTVVLISGFGEFSSDWAWIAAEVRQDTRVCAYDPAGRGWSDFAEAPQDGMARARDLSDVLRAAGESGPYVLVGHSFGGLYARVFAAQYPDQAAGMVLLDATSPDRFRLPSYQLVYEVYRRVSGLFPSMARFGVGRLVYAAARPGLPSPAREEVRAFLSTPKAFRDQQEEWAQGPAAMTQAKVLTSLGDRPLVVVTAALGAQTGWLPLQRQLTELSTNAVQRVLPEATHSGLLEDRNQAKESSAAIRGVVAAVRLATPLLVSAVEGP